jgi:hypothetical protein
MSCALTRLERFCRGSGWIYQLKILEQSLWPTHVFKHGLHESDSGFGRLNKLVFCLFDVKSGNQLDLAP